MSKSRPRMMDRQKPWVACYWRWYRLYRKWGRPRSIARRNAGKIARNWWQYMKVYG